MKREEFYQRAVLELAGAMVNNGAWKVQLDKAVEMAEYLTLKLYGEPFTTKVDLYEQDKTKTSV